ncbi:DUF1275 domain-containing protein [Undibacterium sp. LX40W]|uniref:DUF1275 domain-containing protein n=1 Tax=Undibacterium nitidum TaxID=2762298 RepID=A0A923HUR1_9BURK|nr:MULTISPECIES: YoaK family protein [Undibacterium]MBC3883012.1 DUF1275 domain-containing protein [Undibacterium nitidum]MBC3893293.1 DUF1275 domain-containing protein [Undibacterium sp. LX40W]
MTLHYIAKLTSPKRTQESNLHLGLVLSWIAGALNAGGFLAVGQYTSHMTGIISTAADDLILSRYIPAVAAILMLIAFIIGSATTAIWINYAKRNSYAMHYSPVLFLEAILLLFFGMVGHGLSQHELITVSFTTMLLCYMMGLQNALITKISHAEIRTTHVTGLVTDIGIELGKLCYWNYDKDKGEEAHIRANRHKLRLHSSLVIAFFVGGIAGASGFKYLGFISTVPLSLTLICVGIAPYFDKKKHHPEGGAEH